MLCPFSHVEHPLDQHLARETGFVDLSIAILYRGQLKQPAVAATAANGSHESGQDRVVRRRISCVGFRFHWLARSRDVGFGSSLALKQLPPNRSFA